MWETVQSVAILIAAVPTAVVSMLVRRLWSNQVDIPFKEDLRRSVIRRLSHLPLRIIRQSVKLRDARTLLALNRYRASERQLCIGVSEEQFSGYWLCKGPPGKPQEPNESDIVLFWLHGGAYISGDPLGAASVLLRVAEIAASRGTSTSIFTLDYTLAPEKKIPHQQRQAVAAYRHLLEVERVDASNIIVAGESAGGHLALSFLVTLADTTDLHKPAGGLLLFPWVNLANTSPSFIQNKHKDILTKHLLDRCARAAVGNAAGNNDITRFELVDLTKPRKNGQSWRQIMPAQTWINVGTHDLFVQEIQSFVELARADGARVELELADGMQHGWQFSKDRHWERQYCALDPADKVPSGMMPGSENIAEGLLMVARQCSLTL
ncbi:hypothetical protein AnigIFM63309_000401 [Aspergillus niger]|nr:hypothetical protein AnigIFM63309_000401 [Aspergillus niger]